MGKVIGKQGRIAKAIRTVMKAAAVKETREYLWNITVKKCGQGSVSCPHFLACWS